MKKYVLTSLLISIYSICLFAQNSNTNSYAYRASREKINNLIHTKLDVNFDYSKRQLLGKAWITLKPHFYETDSLKLDAKGMDIKQVALAKDLELLPLKYSYDSLAIKINLDKSYKSNEEYKVFIEYTAKPDELKANGSKAITSAKGLYFINPDSTVAGKPVQIWTQGETESSSVWFPTIDSPNQKTTQEIYITVPSKYKTLSNGLLINQRANNNGTRTDYWKMSLPHAPYLFMMAVGDFRIIEDKWQNIPVQYYLEPKYAPHAKAIFGDTPKMIDFFSKKLDVDYPWEKYAQIVVRDYVSGAMENTTATLHGDFVQQTSKEIQDEHIGEDVIAHELFHHWFGDYVTAESWGNLAINESFANFSEMLWREHKYGKDEGDAKNYEDLLTYLNDSSAKEKDLIRYYYRDKEDMFDLVSYQKGGRILNLLRSYIGEEAFFKSLHLFLKQNAFKTGEAHQFRLAIEEVTGRDMSWFFNQWFFGNGHPELDIKYQWNEKNKTQYVFVKQLQSNKIYTLPVKIDIYSNNQVERLATTLTKSIDTLTFKLDRKPDLVNVDAEKVLLAKKTDHKSMEEYAFQQKNAPLYLDRLEALEAAMANLTDKKSTQIIQNALQDPSYRIRIKAIESLNLQKTSHRGFAINTLKKLAEEDPKNLVRTAAIDVLARTRDKNFTKLFVSALNENSYAIQSAALSALTALNFNLALENARKLEKDAEGSLTSAIVSIYASNGDTNDFYYVQKSFRDASLNEKIIMIQDYVVMLAKQTDTKTVKESIDELYKIGIQNKNYGIDKYVVGLLDTFIIYKKEELPKVTLGIKAQTEEQIKYAEEKINSLLKM
ncbi:Peptidase M1 membrane alanine aminopeptidase [Pseudopedobacter saltans DSM 12145]|uniref:Aminopeptidase N n=1 Tax=Pseudopedobacter saltans (strain ATCC 51119 / DSM 12145 / JCM 21818 / CCUG 39354 / LMG 10337 / NBRC 100064 / NCIMB 13643) TaxID=762903 RepID=F0S4U5_PSESL|nr:M1 family metallopeptidase [Pseudopedobacter saltans]ADY54119.1 Peptidase M1 membrane alanine aminopeptidase [Pseudopedobacter saltans DSM 12145]